MEKIDADARDPITAAADAPAELIDLDADEDTPDAGPADSGAVDECVATLAPYGCQPPRVRRRLERLYVEIDSLLEHCDCGGRQAPETTVRDSD